MGMSLRTLWLWLVLKMYPMYNQYCGVGWGGLTANNVRNKVADYFVTCWSCSLANVKNMNSRVHTMNKRQACMNFNYLCSIKYGYSQTAFFLTCCKVVLQDKYKLLSMPFSFRPFLYKHSALGKSLCTYKRYWKWCPRASVQAWTRLILIADTFCRSACEMSTVKCHTTAHFNCNFVTDIQMYAL
jgi:hypothetical protein